jgi:hypothetical protein
MPYVLDTDNIAKVLQVIEVVLKMNADIAYILIAMRKAFEWARLVF